MLMKAEIGLMMKARLFGVSKTGKARIASHHWQLEEARKDPSLEAFRGSLAWGHPGEKLLTQENMCV